MNKSENWEHKNGDYSVPDSSLMFGSKWAWLEANCWEVKLTYHRDGGGIVQYTIHARFETPKNPMGSKSVYVSNPNLNRVLDQTINQVKAGL